MTAKSGRPSSHINGPAVDETSHRSGALLLYAVSAIWLIAWFWYGYGYWEDDAFIHLEFARSLSLGKGFSFAGIVTYGDTSPLWVFMLVAAHYLFNSWITAGKILSACACIAALSAVRTLALGLTPQGLSPRLFAAVSVLAIAVNQYFVLWFLSGMETLMAIAVASWIIWASARKPTNWSRFMLASMLCGVAPLLRPEFLLLDAVVAPFLIHQAYQVTETKTVPARIAVFSSMMTMVAGPTIGWMSYAYRQFGTVVPNTSAAKRAVEGTSVLARIVVVFGYGFPIIVLIALVLAIYGTVRLRSGGRALTELRGLPWEFPIVAAWVLLTCALYVENRTYVQTRYVLIFAAPLIVSVLALSFRFVKEASAWKMCCAVILAAGLESIVFARPFVGNKVECVARTADLAQFIMTKLPSGKSVATFAIGQLGFQSGHPIIDIGGILNPEVVPYINSPLAVKWAQHQGAAYLIDGADTPPLPGASLIYRSSMPFAAWTIDPRDFKISMPIRVWALPETG